MVAEVKRRTGKIKIANERVEALAAKVDDDYGRLIDAGFRMMASSGVWRTRAHGLTLRFVYRKRSTGKCDFCITHTTIIRGVREVEPI